MVPTEGYALFAMAERNGVTVKKLLTGRDGPLLNIEWKLWQRYYAVQQRLRDQQGK